MTDLKAEARRLAEEAATKVHVQSTWEVQSDSIESALLAFGRLVREEDAKEVVLRAVKCGHRALPITVGEACASHLQWKLKDLE